MNAVVILLVGIVILVLGYIFYGGWLAKQWGVDPKRTTPAHELEDGNDYVPAKAPVLMGHHFSSIAGAGPINGPIQAAVFGWVPVMLWVLIGGIFFGAVHDFGALFASVRNKGQSIGEVIAESIGSRAKKLFLTFSYLTLILVVAAFASIVANTFKATYTESGALDEVASAVTARRLILGIYGILIIRICRPLFLLIYLQDRPRDQARITKLREHLFFTLPGCYLLLNIIPVIVNIICDLTFRQLTCQRAAQCIQKFLF